MPCCRRAPSPPCRCASGFRGHNRPGGRVSDLVIRPLEAGETALFLSYPHPAVPLVGVAGAGRSYPDFVARNEYRPHWTWVALRDGAVVARASWWAGPGDAHPAGLDWFDPGVGPDRLEVGAALLSTAHETIRTDSGELPPYHLLLPPAWRGVPAPARPARTGSPPPGGPGCGRSWSG